MRKKFFSVFLVFVFTVIAVFLSIGFICFFDSDLNDIPQAVAMFQIFILIACTGIVIAKCFPLSAHEDEEFKMLRKILPYVYAIILAVFAAFLGLCCMQLLYYPVYHFVHNDTLALNLTTSFFTTFLTIVCAGVLICKFQKKK